jgi:MFS family permease
MPVRWDARHRALLFVLAGNMLIDALEVSIVLPALPSISRDFGLTIGGAHWLMTGFAAGFAATLLAGTALTGRWGRRRLYLVALLVFAAASVAGGLTGSVAVLIAIRVVKGACAALTAPTGLAIIGDTFSGTARGPAISVYTLFGAAGFTVGLLLSGALTLMSWRWVLIFTAPVALLLMIFAARLIPADVGGSFAVPRLRKRLLTNWPLVRAAAGAGLLNGTYLGLLLLTTFALQERLGWRPWQAALAFLPACLPLAVSAPLAGLLIARFDLTRLITLGALAAAAGYALRFASPVPDSYVLGILPTLVLVGAAFVLSFAALNTRALDRVADRDRPVAVTMYQFAVQCGAVLILGLVAMLRANSATDRPALFVLALGGALAFTVALTGIPVTRRFRSEVHRHDRDPGPA